MCQFCTELCQQATVETDTLGQWLHRMNYAYHEVKAFLASEEFDAARHYEAFRQRAFANGGTLGLESPGQVNRHLVEMRSGWPETALHLHLLRGTWTLLLYRYGEAYAHNPAESLLFRLCMQDKARHLAYGMSHLKYAIDQKGPDFSLGLLRMISAAEQDLAREMRDPVLWEALAIIFGGGVANIVQGMQVVQRLRQRYLTQYLARMQWIGIDKTEENLNPELLTYLRPPEEVTD